MLFRETGSPDLPTIVLFHGGGLSDWSWRRVAERLKPDYHVVTPVIDGHGEDGDEEFTSIEDCAAKALRYITQQHDGKVFAIGGLSLGAQLVAEMLTQKGDVARHAIIESALVCPIRGIAALTAPMYQCCYGLIKKRWFSKLQARALRVPAGMFEAYYQDSLRMSRQSLINMTVSNGTYRLRAPIARTSAKTLVIAGGREIGVMKKSAGLLHAAIPQSRLLIARGMAHGQLSLDCPDAYVGQLKELFSQSQPSI